MSFQSSLRAGQLGEMLFYQAHEGTLKREDGRQRDFTCLSTGEGVELKFDLYPMADTPNFFFERYSNMDKKSPGGPWQAQANGVAHFVYFYGLDLTYFTFKTDELVSTLEELLPKLTPKLISNKSWTTAGYAVPRDLLSGLCVERKIKVMKSAA